MNFHNPSQDKQTTSFHLRRLPGNGAKKSISSPWLARRASKPV